MLPREKALHLGFEALTDEEVLAIILKTGYKGVSITKLCQKLIADYGLMGLMRMDYNQLITIKGIHQAKALELLACLEIVKRVFTNQNKDKSVIKHKADIYQWLMLKLGLLNQEQFIVLYLNTKNQIIHYKVLFIGTLDSSIAHPREIFKYAFIVSAAKIICAHNHPSADLTPSKQDLHLTQLLLETGSLCGIPLLDHIIVSTKGYVSCLEYMKQ